MSEEAIGVAVSEADRGQATGRVWVAGISVEASLSTLDSGLGPGSICSHELTLPNVGFFLLRSASWQRIGVGWGYVGSS